ncbi:hypothetical protein R1sor_000689 [Riccia sorocarpa]|uniref:Replitron HUH endonuclease domain-containing protein n=1 Tax=Riccia sorocarpa TaxID=122646 RepID=A0ABD3GTS8_9MARC
MDKVRYELDGVFPKFLTLGELAALNTGPKRFSTTKVSEHLGRVGVIPAKWTEQHLDWYLAKVEFVTVRKLFKRRETIDGPFKYIEGDSKLVILEDCEGVQFQHPKFSKKTEDWKKLYRSTTAWFWASRCFCEDRSENTLDLPVTCFCGEFFGLFFCLKCGPGTGIHELPDTKKVRQYVSEETEDTEIEQALSQNVCLCEELFDSGNVCFCGYRSRSGHESRSESPEVHMGGEGETSVDDRDGRSALEAASEEPISVQQEEHIDGATFDRLAVYVEETARKGIIVMERGDSHLQLHIQGMLSVKTSSTRSLKTEIRQAIGWNEDNHPADGSICIKSLKDTFIDHTVIGMIGYCLKDEQEEHYRKYTKNISEQELEDGRQRHFIYGASVYKNRLELTPNNILGRALQYRKYRARNPLSISFRGCLRQMLSSGQYIPAFKWLSMSVMSRLRAELLWKSCIAHELVPISDVDHIFFGTTDSPRFFEENEKPQLNMDAKAEPMDADADPQQQHVQCGLNRTPVKKEPTTGLTTIKEEPSSELESEDSDEGLDIVELEDIAAPGADLQHLLSDLLCAGYNVATKRRTDQPQPQVDANGAETGSNIVGLDDLAQMGADVERILGDLLFAGYTVAPKRNAIEPKKPDFLPAYIPLCRSNATGDLKTTAARSE